MRSIVIFKRYLERVTLGFILFLNIILAKSHQLGKPAQYSNMFEEFGDKDFENDEKASLSYWFNQKLDHFNKSIRETRNLSLANLKYLTISQILEDNAQFTLAMTRLFNLQGSKWVVFGASYAGALAVWFRSKYPHIIHSAVTTSATVDLNSGQKEPFGVIRDVVELHSKKCLSEIYKATDEITRLAEDKSTWKELKVIPKLCYKYDGSKADFWYLFKSLSFYSFEDVAVSNGVHYFNGVTGLGNISIANICDIMEDPKTISSSGSERSNALRKYLAVTAYVSGNVDCYDFRYHSAIEILKNEMLNGPAPTEKSFVYQGCTELGYFLTSGLNRRQPFGQFPVDLFLQQCRDLFGNKYTRKYIESSIKKTNLEYGGKYVGVTRVIFVNGDRDPWYPLGVTEWFATSKMNLVLFLKEFCTALHMRLMFFQTPNEVPDLKEATVKILNQLKK